MKKAKLCVSFQGIEKEFHLKDVTTIGRKKENIDITLDDPMISRLHARIFEEEGEFFLEDLSSFRRTYLNDEPVEASKELKDQDRIKFANIEAVFFCDLSGETTIDESFVGSPNPLHEATNVESDQLDWDEAYTGLISDSPDVTQPFSRISRLERKFAEIEASSSSPAEKTRRNVEFAELICFTNGQTITISKDVIYVGQDAKNDLVISKAYFSKVQFSIIHNKNAQSYHLKHLGSNDTRIDGVAVDSMFRLSGVMTITVGEYVFYFFERPKRDVHLYKSILSSLEDTSTLKEIALFSPREDFFFQQTNLLCHYQVVSGQKGKNPSAVFFARESQGGVYIFWGEVYWNNAGIGKNKDFFAYITKMQGIFEAVVDYANTPTEVIGGIHRNIYSRFPGVWVIGTLLFASSDRLKWIGGGCAPLLLFRKDGRREVFKSPGTPLGGHELFLGQEHGVTWTKGDKLLVFSKNMLQGSVRSDSHLLLNIESIKSLFRQILKDDLSGGQVLEKFLHTMGERTNNHHEFVTALLEI